METFCICVFFLFFTYNLTFVIVLTCPNLYLSFPLFIVESLCLSLLLPLLCSMSSFVAFCFFGGASLCFCSVRILFCCFFWHLLSFLLLWPCYLLDFTFICLRVGFVFVSLFASFWSKDSVNLKPAEDDGLWGVLLCWFLILRAEFCCTNA